MGDDKEAQHVEAGLVPEIERENAAILLDVGVQGGPRTGLKLAKDGHTVLIPQPSEDPDDPLNWSQTKKRLLLFTVGVATFITDFQAAVAVPDLVPQAEEWHMSPVRVNDANNLNVLMIGVGGLVWLPFISLCGRAPVLFWLNFCGTLLTLGCCLVQNFTGYYGIRILMGLCFSVNITVGLAFIQDVYFMHQQARMIGLYTMMFLISPYLAPLFGYFINSGTDNWRITYWMTFALGCVILSLCLFFLDESWYRRDIPKEQQPNRGSRILRVLGVWQIRQGTKYFMTPVVSVKRLLAVLVKPIIIPWLLYYSMNIMWAIGINQNTAVLFETPRSQGGYGLGVKSVGYLCFTPVVGNIIGVLSGHWSNDWVTRRYIARHEGIFKPEARLSPVYFAQLLMAIGLILVGQTLGHLLHWVGLVFGWGTFAVGQQMITVGLEAYALDAYPNAPAEVAALNNAARIISGFSTGYFQLDWGLRMGFDKTFGIQAAISAASTFILIWLHMCGEKARARSGPLKL